MAPKISDIPPPSHLLRAIGNKKAPIESKIFRLVIGAGSRAPMNPLARGREIVPRWIVWVYNFWISPCIGL